MFVNKHGFFNHYQAIARCKTNKYHYFLFVTGASSRNQTMELARSSHSSLKLSRSRHARNSSRLIHTDCVGSSSRIYRVRDLL